MRKITSLFIAMSLTVGNATFAQTEVDRIDQLGNEISLLKASIEANNGALSLNGDKILVLENKLIGIESELAELKGLISANKRNISSLSKKQGNSDSKIEVLNLSIDGLKDTLNQTSDVLKDSLALAQSRLSNDIKTTNEKIATNDDILHSSIKEKTTIGLISVLSLLLLGIVLFVLFRKNMKKSSSAIEDIKSVQGKLQDAQLKLEEESLKLDNKLIEIYDKQMNVSSVQPTKPDHSLSLKVADEIVRIEMNLSRMDTSIKGYKQLAKAVERIKNNFLSKGYEISDMLNKTYNDGLKISADFVMDENLDPGTRIITSITKPQVIYNGELIQKAIVTVTQNI